MARNEDAAGIVAAAIVVSLVLGWLTALLIFFLFPSVEKYGSLVIAFADFPYLFVAMLLLKHEKRNAHAGDAAVTSYNPPAAE